MMKDEKDIGFGTGNGFFCLLRSALQGREI